MARRTLCDYVSNPSARSNVSRYGGLVILLVFSPMPLSAGAAS
jgi:hypothetical protein